LTLGIEGIDVQWLQASVDFPLLLGQSRVLEGVGFSFGPLWGRPPLMHAGGLVVDPVSDNSTRFHERYTLLTLAQRTLLHAMVLLWKGWMLKPANPASGALWIRRQTGRLSGWAYGSDNIVVVL
jgi:hypothetical protein